MEKIIKNIQNWSKINNLCLALCILYWSPIQKTLEKLIVNFILIELNHLHLSDSNANGNSNGRRTYARLGCNGNLVIHFHKNVYIPGFLDTELWKGLGWAIILSKKGTFVLIPLNQIIPIFNKISLCKVSGKTFSIFHVQVFCWIWILS